MHDQFCDQIYETIASIGDTLSVLRGCPLGKDLVSTLDEYRAMKESLADAPNYRGGKYKMEELAKWKITEGGMEIEYEQFWYKEFQLVNCAREYQRRFDMATQPDGLKVFAVVMEELVTIYKHFMDKDMDLFSRSRYTGTTSAKR